MRDPKGERAAWAFAAALTVTLASTRARADDAALKLEDAVQLALTRNERAAITDANVVVANAAVEKARAAFLPTLVVTGSDTQRPYTNEKNGVVTQPSNIAQAQATLTQPLVNIPGFPLYAQAKNLLAAQKSQTIDDKRVLSFDAARAFLTALSAAAVADAAKHHVDTANANLADTAARVQAALTSSNDATRAELDLATAQRLLVTDQGQLDSAKIALEFVINAPVPAKLVAPDATMTAAKQPVKNVGELSKFAIDHRPDLDSKQKAFVAAKDFADEPLMRLFPTLNATALFSVTSNTSSSGRWNDEAVGLSFSWTLYDAGVRYADKHSRDAQAEIADYTARALARQIDAQVRAAVAALNAARSAFEIADKEVQASRKNSDETSILYKQGLAKAIELVDANDSLFAAEVDYVVAEYAMAQAYLDLRQAVGLTPIGSELK